MAEPRVEWKSTLNLPETAFPMKAQLAQREPLILKKWHEAQIYDKILRSRKDLPRYILHDGPPYANGNIHLGTALNKILKDIVAKSKSMAGYLAPYVPGWDCHGLPIEHKVDQKLGEVKKTMPVLAIREECRKYAEHYLDLQREDFKRLGVFGEWDNPYTTIDPAFEAAILRFLNSFVKSGSLYRKKRPVYWCTSCATALAEAEVEYGNHTSPSITVAFALREFPAVLAPFSAEGIDILIWTTTPWTIPANLAIAVHPEFDYMLFRMNGHQYIAASRLVPVVAGEAGQPFEKIVEFKGAELAGLHARHPLLDRDSLVINTDYVLLDQGTGCVHTAPGHGEDDYHAGLANGLDIYSPVGPTGLFDETAGPYAGQHVFAANGRIVADLEAAGRLLRKADFEHSYPHCWRCHKPVIFRATEQWFIAMDTAGLRQKALAEIGQVRWIPAWGEERIANMIAGRPDWCISRQRSWGVPLPAFFCTKCQQPLIDSGAVEKTADLFARYGSNVWFERPAADFLPPGTTCPHCGGGEFEQGRDILDVWFESGSSHGILEKYPRHNWPADLYLEGGDQYRGWFHSSLLVGVSAHGKAPYRTVITHGWVLDREGKTMHKSLGNAIEPQTIIRDKGAEVLRLWAASVNYQEDVRLGDEILARLVETYRKIRNTWRFMLGVLADFSPDTDSVAPETLADLDRYILARFAEVKDQVRKGYEEYEFHLATHALTQFFTVDLSALYLHVQKDNLYCNTPALPARRAAQTVIFRLLKESLLLMAPILSFTTEEAWEMLPAFAGKESFIHLHFFPAPEPAWELPVDLDTWKIRLELRDRVLKSIETARAAKQIGDSLEAEVALTAPEEVLAVVRADPKLFRDLLVVSALTLTVGETERIDIRRVTGRKCPRCWNWFTHEDDGGLNPELCPRCAAVVAELPLETF